MFSFRNLFMTLMAALFLAALNLTPATAQDAARTEVTTLYNSAQEEAQAGNFDEAIALFKDALGRAEKAGLQDIKGLVTEQLPRVYSARAASLYREFQKSKTIANVDATIKAFKDAQAAGKTYNDANAASQAANAIPQLYYAKSLVQFSQRNLDGAKVSLDEAIVLNPRYAAAYYQKGVVLRREAALPILEIVEWFDKAIANGQATNQSTVVGNARTQAVETLLFEAVNIEQKRQFAQAMELLAKADSYGTNSPDVYYRMAEIQNKRSQHVEAIANAEKALSFEKGSASDKAKIYFELGLAHQFLNNRAEACAAMRNAAFGDFRESANYKMDTELKCANL